MSFDARAAAALAIMLATAGSAVAGDKPSSSAAPGEKLSASEIRALLPGEFKAVWKDTHEVHVEASADGAVRGSTGILADSGRWSLRGDELCISFRWWTWNEPRCTEVRRDGSWYVGLLRSNGKPRVRFRPQ